VNSFEEIAIITPRLALTQLQVEDADEMARVLDSEIIHEFIGGRPLAVGALRRRYARLVAGATNPGEAWLNWIVRRRCDSQPVGTVQATLTIRDGRVTAVVAWVIGVEYQRQGFATEAAQALVAWLRGRGADSVLARIHPGHQASARVALRAGLRPTADREDGEQIWRTPEAVDLP
jgi:RimJ/RimL family protein N-acetyltransferase